MIAIMIEPIAVAIILFIRLKNSMIIFIGVW